MALESWAAASLTGPVFDAKYDWADAKTVYVFRVRLFVSRQSEIDSQRTIDAYCSPTGVQSLKGAIEDGNNWGATIDYAQVTRIGDTGVTEIGGSIYLSVEFDIEVVW